MPRLVDRRLIGFALACGLVAWVALMLGGHDLIDLEVYRRGGRAVLDGTPVYEQAAGLLPFTYPPFAALLMVPLVVLPTVLSQLLLVTASCLALVVVARAIGLSRRATVLVTLGALALEPIRQTLQFGQVNLLLLALVVVDLGGRDHRWRGVLVGVAAGIKLTPLVFVGLLVVTGQWRAARTSLVAFAATIAVPLVVARADVAAYWTSVLPDPGRIGAAWYATNQSLMGALSRLGHDAAWVRPMWLLLAASVGIVALVLARRLWQADDRMGAIAAAGLAGLLASPVSWSHHWVWVLPLAATLLRWYGVRPMLAWLAPFVVAPFLMVPRAADRELTWTPWEHVAGNAYVWLGLAWLIAVAVAVRRRTVPSWKNAATPQTPATRTMGATPSRSSSRPSTSE